MELLDFILVGRFDFLNSTMSDLLFVLQTPIDKAAQNALKACGAPMDTYSDGSVHARIVMSQPVPTAFVAPANMDCIVNALPKGRAAEAKFLTENFRDIAIGMLRDGTIDKVRHEGVAIFFRQVAASDVSVGVLKS